MNNIYLFSRPIRSGKTTDLINWINNRHDCAGILTPDKDEFRQMYFIDKKEYIPFECRETYPRKEFIEIGNFRFYSEAFDSAHEYILLPNTQTFKWVIIDEVGKLELRGGGFEPALHELIEKYKERKVEGHLLLVIRDYLLQEAIDHYGLTQALVVNQLDNLS